VIDLFEQLMRGDIAAALTELRDQYDSGADPLIVLTDLAEFTHFVTRVKAVPTVAEDRSLPEAERLRGRALAAALSMRTLSRAWQMLFKGLAEVGGAAKPIAAAEMVLVRIAYAADLPTPDEVIRTLAKDTASAGGEPAPSRERARAPGGASPSPASRAELAPPPLAPPPRGVAQPSAAARATAPAREPRAALAADPAAPAPRPIASFVELIALAAERRDLTLKAALERDVRLVRFEDGKLEVALEPSASKALIGDLARKLGELTNRRWMVVLSAEQGEPPVRAQLQARQAELERGVQADPLVQSVLARFPGAEIVAVRSRAGEEGGLPPVAEADDALPEPANEDETSAFGAHARSDDIDDNA
ncbi:MAG: DNA polymerase III subunit gamma/tau, partial [Bradyrhizobiaceae bacterium]|nr:DNA polymerase III subunit gamma/tau [Bradyrhizobiaceae bacterium]